MASAKQRKEGGMPQCCLYERSNGQRWTYCTTDAQCSNIPGDTFLASWGVGDCADCLGTITPPDDGGRVVVPAARHPIFEMLELLEKAPLLVEKLKALGYDPTKPPKLPG